MKRNIAINEKNTGRINAEFDAIQARCTVRCCDARDVFRAVKEITAKMNITKKALEGCSFVVRPYAKKVAKSYKCDFVGTVFEIQVENGKFQLCGVFRSYCDNRKKYQAYLTDTAKEAIIHDYMFFD